MIADDSGVLSLAGIMGGASTEVGSETTDILLEAATWDPLAVFKTARRHKLSSEAGKRFERVVDPEIPVAALDRAAALLVDIAGGRVDPALTDIGEVTPHEPIHMDIDLPDRVAVSTTPTAPLHAGSRRSAATWRSGSATADTVSSSPARRRGGPIWCSPPTWWRRCCASRGSRRFRRCCPQPRGSWVDSGAAPQARRRPGPGVLGIRRDPASGLPAHGDLRHVGLAPEDPRRNTSRVLNPLESDRPELPTTLLPGLLEVLARNVSRGQRDLSLFGIAQVVLPGADTKPVEALPVDRRPTDEQITALLQSLPDQPVHVAAVLTGQREPSGPWGEGRAADATDAFAAARTVAAAAGVELEFRATQYLPWHPGRGAELLVNGVVVGHAGELHPAVLERAGLPRGRVPWRSIWTPCRWWRTCPRRRSRPSPRSFRTWRSWSTPRYPPPRSRRPCGQVEELLEDIRLFDVFEGEQVGEGRKSLAFALRFRGVDRTLTEDEASAARDAAVAAASAAVGAELRS